MNLVERMMYEPKGGMFRRFAGITTHLAPRDPALYRRLLPEPFAMPERPVVTIFVADYVEVFPWPMTRYQEWAVLLNSVWKGEVGGYVVTMPVTKWVPMWGGRYLGFPKYVAQEIVLDRSGGGWQAVGRHRGALQLSLEFTPGLTRQLESWEAVLIENESFFKGDAHLLVPPGRGPRAQKVRLDHVVPPAWAPEPGMVRVRAGRGEVWADLVGDGAVSPGTFNQFTGGTNLVAER